MPKVTKVLLFIFLIVFVYFISLYFYLMNIQKKCKKKYTIGLIFNSYETITEKKYASLKIKYLGNYIIEKNVGVTSLYAEKIGEIMPFKDGYYFFNYCEDKPDLRTIYTNIKPCNIDVSYLDSTWNTYEDMIKYSNYDNVSD